MDPSIILTLICLIFIVGMYLCHSIYKKVTVKPEFESEALQILNEKWQLKRDTSLSKEELLVQRLLLEKRADQLVEQALCFGQKETRKKTKIFNLLPK
ncbi:hypothetical protein [Pseudoalteromonas piscicida]|uniref:hypothetical protein n=1 Tax=Pseudoalteromonas piscicida TaxID=43662 RepID=UPI0030B527A6